MVLIPSLLVAFAALALLVRSAHSRRGLLRRGFVTMHPAFRGWLRQQRLIEPGDFLRLDALIVSGHPGRNVGRVVLGDGTDERTLYVKREQYTSWRTRLWHLLVGHGWVSRCVREADLLAALERDGLPAPRWLATGEDEAGRAFLLVEAAAGAVPLARLLAETDDPYGRRELAVRLGQTLARVHAAGFFHRDLYAKHVLVRPEDAGIFLLDWQRAWRGAWIPLAARIRDLASLHATLPETLANRGDRLAFVRAYAEQERSPAWRRARFRSLLTEIDAHAHRLRNRRHIREKRQPPTGVPQEWIHLDGEALSITPTLAELAAGRPLDWLALDRQPAGPAAFTHRWLTLAGRRLLLARRRQRVPLPRRLGYRVLGRPLIAPEQRRATLLWRLARHGIPAPRVLAMGHKDLGGGETDSFLLSEPIPRTVRLGLWLRQIGSGKRGGAFRLLGRLVARLHEACCYLPDDLDCLAVCVEGGRNDVVLEHVEGLKPYRRPQPLCASQDLSRVEAFLASAGCGPAGWQEVLAGYREEAGASPVVPRDQVPRGLSPAHSGTLPVNPLPSLWRRLLGSWRRLVERPDWSSFVGEGWEERVMGLDVTDRFFTKQGRSTGRCVLPARDGSGRELRVYLKRHYQLPRLHGLLAALFPGGSFSPAMQEYDHLEWARSQGVPVPATVAAGEFVGPWGKLQSFLAVEELTDMLPVNEAVPLAQKALAPEEFRLWKRGLVAEMARLSRLLHDRRHFHKDLYLCHFFVHQDDVGRLPAADGDDPAAGWRGRVSLIDLHRLTHHPRTWWLWRLKDLAQLLYSSEVPGVDVRDQVAFWTYYRGPGAQGWASRLLRWCVLLKWRRYRAHNLRMKERRKKSGS